jgi:Transposase DDE domain
MEIPGLISTEIDSRVTETIKRELRRRSAIEPVIGHAKAEHRMGRNFLAGREGDAANAVLAAAGYNFRRLLEWLALLLSTMLTSLVPRPVTKRRSPRRDGVLHGRLLSFACTELARRLNPPPLDAGKGRPTSPPPRRARQHGSGHAPAPVGASPSRRPAARPRRAGTSPDGRNRPRS